MSSSASASGAGVPSMASVATSATEGERFSLPPAWEGRRVPALEDWEKSVGVADTSRTLDARERLSFRGAFDVLSFLEVAVLLWALFLLLESGFSGTGHSTSRVRSSLSAWTHSGGVVRCVVVVVVKGDVYRPDAC